MTVEIKEIKKKYGKKEVLKDVSFRIEGGQCIGILGGNGCGKSTLLSILAGIKKRDSGAFLYDGKDLFSYPKVREKLVGYIPQGTPLIEELSAKDNLSLWYSKEEMKKELKDGVLRLLGIDEFLSVTVSKMSGGMAALDIACKQKIFSYVEEHKKKGGIAMIVTHDVMELSLCDTCYIIKDGIAHPFDYQGDPEELIRNF